MVAERCFKIPFDTAMAAARPEAGDPTVLGGPLATIGTSTAGSLDLSRSTDTGMATPQTKRRAPASPGISPGKTIPEYSKCVVDPTDIMKEVIHAAGAGRDSDRLVQALRTSLEKAVTSMAKVAEAVNSHAEHFKLHHEAISWCVQRFRTCLLYTSPSPRDRG